jgi:UPF0755 protein
MIDELDLAFDEHAERGGVRSHRRGGGKGKKGGKTGGRSTVAFLMAFILLAVLGGGVYLGYNKIRDFFTAADYDGGGTGTVQVQIPDNATLTEMGDVLVDKDVVKSTKAFTQAAEKNPRGKNIQSGTFNLKLQMSGEAAVVALLDPKSRVSKGITIPEGTTSVEAYAILSKATGVPVAEFKTAAKNPEALGVPDFWFKRNDGQKATRSIEGFLFPDTYEFEPSDTAEDMLTDMVSHFLAQAEKLDFVNQVQEQRKISPYEALIVASLAQAEAGNNDDMGKVARVAYNRIYSKTFPCDCLQFDVGINYYYELTGRKKKASKDMTIAELTDPKNPYRTHGKPGLTPTPINNPGLPALKGAMSPPAGAWLYFVAIDKQGHSAFATTLEGHRKNEATARKNGVL